jgi:hypothetical protein
MQFNLKNRPKHPNIVWDKDYEEWFEGFEAELRLKLLYPTNTKSTLVYDFIKEISGE